MINEKRLAALRQNPELITRDEVLSLLNAEPVAWAYKEYVWARGIGYVWREKLEDENPGDECNTLKEVTPLYPR